jgi:N-hydroxyarylamine O-acetyltransferase
VAPGGRKLQHGGDSTLERIVLVLWLIAVQILGRIVNTIERAAYLARINYGGPTVPSAAVLADLQLAHLAAVPFENLSIHAGEAIELRPDWLFDKIVRRRRGGFCYELNGLFAELLLGLGFEVDRLAARVHGAEGRLGIPFDHMCLRAVAGEIAWLVDVGFGDHFVRPLVLDDARQQSDGRRCFRIEPDGDERVLWDGAKPSFRFTLEPFALAEFAPGRDFHTTSSESPFTRRRVISLLTAEGRITLLEDRLIVTAGDDKHEQPIANADEWRRLAAERFGIALAEVVDLRCRQR